YTPIDGQYLLSAEQGSDGMAFLTALERLRSPFTQTPHIPDSLLVAVRQRAGAAMENVLE
ncbi:hypothetical protein AAVH_42884, partial [Aphelenchoides avenae]